MMNRDIQYIVRHTNRFTYSTPISESVMEVRMQPRSDVRQRCLGSSSRRSRARRCSRIRMRPGTWCIISIFRDGTRGSRSPRTRWCSWRLPQTCPTACPTETWDELDAIAGSGERWEDLQFSRFARETPLLVALADEIHWQRDADPLTLLRRLNYALFHQFTYAPRTTTWTRRSTMR